MWLIQIPMTILLHASRSNGTFNAEASADGPEAERLHTVAFRMFWGTMMVGTGPLLGRLRLHSVMTAFKPLHRDQGARDLGPCMEYLSCASVSIPCRKLEHRCTGTLGRHSQPHSGYEARTAPQRRQAGNAGDLTSMLEIAVGPHLYV